jgi:MFS family permease
MIQGIIYRLLRRRHFWRYATFSEVAELYASRTMRILAQQMIGLFIALYLYEQHYSVVFIAAYMVLNFGFRAIMSYPCAKFIARFGPKHGILAGNLLYIPALVGFSLVPHLGVPAIAVFGFFQSISMVIYDMSYLIDFSKVKHAEHAGKELGYMQILERFTASISPFVGGVIAFVISPEAMMWFSALLFALAAIPLLRTREQVHQHQKLSFRGFPWRLVRRSIVAETAVGFDGFASLGVWALFLAIVVFAGSGSEIYLKIGFFASITVLTSFLAAYSFGRIIDWRHGGDLLRVATLANAATHLFRPFVTAPIGVVAANISNEIATTGYTMTFLRGVFDTADVSRHRITYLFLIEMALNVGAMIAALVLLGLVLVMPNVVLALQLFFVITAAYFLIVLRTRFPLYR